MIGSRFHWDNDGKIIEERVQDVEPILNHNKALLTDGDDGYSPSREMKRVASIPNVVIEQWMREGVNVFDPNDAPEIARRLNSNQWRHLRTAEGNV